jgi:hypothetical protein
MTDTKVEIVYARTVARCLKCGRVTWLYPWVLSGELEEMELLCRGCFIEELNHQRHEDRLEPLSVEISPAEQGRILKVYTDLESTTYLFDVALFANAAGAASVRCQWMFVAGLNPSEHEWRVKVNIFSDEHELVLANKYCFVVVTSTISEYINVSYLNI